MHTIELQLSLPQVMSIFKLFKVLNDVIII